MDSVICQQALREAFSPTEVQIAKARQEQLLDFQGVRRVDQIAEDTSCSDSISNYSSSCDSFLADTLLL